MKVIKILLIEILILIAAAAAGFGLDHLLFFSGEPEAGVIGHPVPVFTIVLPAAAILVMVIVDVILVIKAIIRNRMERD